MTGYRVTSRLRRDSDGQSLIEAALTLPLLFLIVFGTVEVGYALVDSHTVTRLTREGSNLISRNTTLYDAGMAMDGMRTGLVDFGSNSRVIFSVLKRGGTTGTANYDRLVLYQRYEFGSLPGTSRIITAGAGTFGPGPDYVAVDSDNDSNLRVTNGAPPNVVTTRGGLVYVTEVFSVHPKITPVHNFGITVPDTLYSVAYF